MSSIKAIVLLSLIVEEKGKEVKDLDPSQSLANGYAPSEASLMCSTGEAMARLTAANFADFIQP